MNREFVPYAESLELKELGFDEPCLGAWAEHGFMTPNDVSTLQDDITIEDIENTQDENMCLSPLYQQAFRWFRDKKLSDACICRYQSRDDGGVYYYYIINHDFGIKETRHLKEGFFSYEQAELACLRKLIEICRKIE